MSLTTLINACLTHRVLSTDSVGRSATLKREDGSTFTIVGAIELDTRSEMDDRGGLVEIEVARVLLGDSDVVPSLGRGDRLYIGNDEVAYLYRFKATANIWMIVATFERQASLSATRKAATLGPHRTGA